ncbi:MAG: ATP-binding protein [Chloroflexi bacterium]|nr:ATP-binding protein [Chloroflexota bacterium]
MANKFKLNIDSRVERLAEIAEFVEDAAQACGFSADAAYELQMAVDEACANVIEHAYAGKPGGKIEIACEKRGDEFVVVIKDHGKRFDPRRVAPPKTDAPLSKRDVGGLGIFFMYKLMDRVNFDFSRGQNVLTMVKKIR